MTFHPFQHGGLKVVSLGLAVVLWLIVAGDQTVERGLRVPLELQQFPDGLELQEEPPALVDVRVRGSSDSLSRMGAGDIVAVLDLRAARPGRRLFQLTPEQVRTPFGVEAVQVSPASVSMVFEKAATRRLPVVPAVEGEPAPGYVVGKVISDPGTVEVVGPESAIKEATEAVTEPVSIAGATAEVVEDVMVGFIDSPLRLKSARLATVRVQVLPGPRERTIRNRAVHLRNVGSNLTPRAIPQFVDIVVRGSREGLSRLDPEAVTAFVDLSGLGAGEYPVAVKVDELPDAGFVRAEPSTVQVHLASAKD
jgi:YbbR domain-containing protein